MAPTLVGTALSRISHTIRGAADGSLATAQQIANSLSVAVIGAIHAARARRAGDQRYRTVMGYCLAVALRSLSAILVLDRAAAGAPTATGDGP